MVRFTMSNFVGLCTCLTTVFNNSCVLLQTLQNTDIEMAAAYCSPTTLSSNSFVPQHELSSPSREVSRHAMVERRPSYVTTSMLRQSSDRLQTTGN